MRMRNYINYYKMSRLHRVSNPGRPRSERRSFDKYSIGSSLYSFIRILTLTLKPNPTTDPNPNPTPWT